MHTESQKVGWLKGIIEAVHDGILVIDREGIVQLINDEYTNITGVKKEQIIGKPLLEVRPGAMLPSVLKDGKPRAGVFRKENKMEYVVDMAPVFENQEIIGAVSVCKSIPEVFLLTKELKKSRKRVSQLEKTFGRIHQAKYTFSNIIGNNERLKKIIAQARKAAASELNILLTGESGTGKELFAQAIHNESVRSSSPFVPVNCAAIPNSLLESELFGYEEGSFTNSKRDGKVGLFELANQGTLFLDEIGDMPLDLQAKLLRVLQEGTFRKIGGLEEQNVDVRVIAATNKDLLSMVQKERFREDLFYRINTVHLSIPPLRERKDDLPDLISFLLNEQKSNPDARINREAMNILQQYDWPGNIRELKNTIHYAISMCEGNEVRNEHLPDTIKKRFIPAGKKAKPFQPLEELIRETEKKAIMKVLEQTGASVKGKKEAAKLLGISLASLYNKITKLHIPL
ncbi:sigma-54 interaction domain-containing protein [Cytobacillus sp. NCCP-133]|uniref:sigma-54 interaction domain-containing protein n=1 Tax=Cytobacillus sp. NCCP-133 TaxID=766848 RepID=UPI00222FEFC9|nr:sigma 54-interacting transcriptional regulator [Cytobacillus sp. NCCP-133]GLB60249.1 sigma-54-dependent Fis family transcriptional regulator [Cytobacillus sp. NCCP-133]